LIKKCFNKPNQQERKEMDNKNLKLWQQVEKTDLAFVKKVNQRGGYTAISPQYQLKTATEKFGPYGSGFGLCKSDFDMSIYEFDGVVIHRAIFFYVLDGQRVEFPITNAIQAAKTTKNGKFVDVDFAKKVETNTVSKALSKIGFNADVYMGMFEDDQYLYELNNEQAIEKAADKDEEKANQAKALYEDTNKVIEQINQASTISILEGLFKAMARRIGDKDKTLLIALTKAKDEAKERLNNG
jgi:hypothetical protein